MFSARVGLRGGVLVIVCMGSWRVWRGISGGFSRVGGVLGGVVRVFCGSLFGGGSVVGGRPC